MSLDFAALLHKIAQEKQAETVAEGVARIHASALAGEATKDIRNAAILALGVGAAGRGVAGLVNSTRRRLRPAKSMSGPVEVPVTLPRKRKDDEEKTAQDPAPAPGMSIFGYPVTKKENIPWRPLGMMLGIGAGGYAGWKGVDAILDKKRQDDLQAELELSRSQFQDAIMGEEAKQASDAGSSLSRKLDQLYERVKSAGAGDPAPVSGAPKSTWIGDGGGKALGMYGAYAGPAALLAGYAAYKAGEKRQRKTILADALKFRQRQRYLAQPTALYATTPEEEEAASSAVV